MIEKTIYWAVLLRDGSRKKLLKKCKPIHSNVFAEHTTIIFNPTQEQDKMMMNQLGHERTLTVTGFKTDDKGDAIVITGQRRLNGGIPHITISCSDKVKPFYSNKLLDGGWDFLKPFELYGIVARYTKKGWDNGKG